MFAGGSRISAPKYNVEDQDLTLRPYHAKLGAFTASLCKEIGQEGQEPCLFETRTAFDCVLRNKVRKGGNNENNVGKCSYHVE